MDMDTHTPVPPQVVGEVALTGEIQNTNLAFKHRKVIGGIAYTEARNYLIEGNDLIDPLTGDRFKLCRSGKGYFSRLTHRFIKPYVKYIEERGEK
jgi:hypothetical protein